MSQITKEVTLEVTGKHGGSRQITVKVNADSDYLSGDSSKVKAYLKALAIQQHPEEFASYEPSQFTGVW